MAQRRKPHHGAAGARRAAGPSRRRLPAWAGWLTVGGAVVLVAGWLGLRSAGATTVRPTGEVGTAVGDTAPSFTVRDIQGRVVGLAAHRPTLLYFVAAWCSSCAYGDTQLRQVYARYGHAVRLITVDVDPQQDTPQMVAAFAHAYGGPWPVVRDTSLTLARLYQVRSLDTSYLINARHVIVLSAQVPLSAAQWEARLVPWLHA